MSTEHEQALARPPLVAASGSAVPDKAGFYWWRPSPLHMWHMVHIQDHAEGIRKTPYLVAYDVSFSSFYGRDLKSWKEFFDVGEWVRVEPPNSEMSDRLGRNTDSATGQM